MNEAGAEKRAEMPEVDLWGSGRNLRKEQIGASNVPVRADKSTRLGGQGSLEAGVERDAAFQHYAGRSG